MDEGANGDGMPAWTRSDVARHLGVSVTTVRRLEGRVLHPSVDANGVRHFEVTEVRSVKVGRQERPVNTRDREGETAARVFELLRSGLGLRDIVIRAKVAPRVVRALYGEWLTSLQEGEQKRRSAALAAEDDRERRRMERDQRKWSDAMIHGKAGV